MNEQKVFEPRRSLRRKLTSEELQEAVSIDNIYNVTGPLDGFGGKRMFDDICVIVKV